jgi:aconitate hydratase
MKDSFQVRDTFEANGKPYHFASLAKLGQRFDIKRLPYSLKILLENLLRHEDGVDVTAKEIEAIARWDAKAEPSTEIAFMPARVMLQDFTGVPCVVDLAAMRDAVVKLGGDATQINPLNPVELVIDHSVQVDALRLRGRAGAERGDRVPAQPGALQLPALGPAGLPQLQGGAAGHRHRAPGEPGAPGARGVRHRTDGVRWAYPDTLVGTDSHTTMVNGLGVLGWGVGGIEAEAAMLGQPVSMLIPQVVGFEAHGPAARRRHRHRPGAHRHRRCCASRAWWASSWSSSATGPQAPRAGRPRHHRQHGARVRRHLRLLPGRRRRR